MIVLNAKGNILADCASFYIAQIPDNNDATSIFCYCLTGVTTTGKPITVGRYGSEQSAMEAMKFLARKFNAVDMFRIDSNNQLNIKE